MKVKAIVTFKDLREKKIRKAGEEFDISEERYEEILKKGKYVEPMDVEPKEAEPKEEEAKEAEPEEAESKEEVKPKGAKTAKKTKAVKEKVEEDL